MLTNNSFHVSQCTVIILRIGTPYLLNIHDLKFETVHPTSSSCV